MRGTPCRFAGASHLYDHGAALLERYRGGVPGLAPGFHPPFEGQGRVPYFAQLVSREQTGPASRAYGHYWRICGQVYICQCVRIAFPESLVCINMDAARNGPLSTLIG